MVASKEKNEDGIKMNERIADFDWLFSIILSSTPKYRQLIARASSEQLTSLLLCSKICAKCKHLHRCKGLLIVKNISHSNFECTRKYFIRNEKGVKEMVKCVLYCLVFETVRHVISCT